MGKYLLLGLGGVSVIVFGAYLWMSRPPAPIVGANGTVVQVAALMNLAENTCLVSKKLTGSATVDVNAAVDTLSGKGSAATTVEDLKGAIDVVNDSLKLQANAAISGCMQKYTDQIFALVMGKTANGAPRQFDLRFSMEFAEPNSPVYVPDAVFIGEKLRSSEKHYLRPDPTLAAPPDSIYAWPNVLLPSKDNHYVAALHRVVKDGYRASKQAIEICLVDGKSPPEGAGLYAVFGCNETAGQCKRNERDDPGWVGFCTPEKSASYSLPGLIPAAHAAEPPAKVWNVPSIETLRERKDLRGSGFTEFRITAPFLPGEKIDSVVLDLNVNGTPVRIDGVDPEYRVVPYSAARGLDVEFALQNLDFAGVNSGCDVIEARLQPVSDGRPLGSPISLKRSYVALRDAEPASLTASGTEFTWTGTYIRPDNAFDYEVIVLSVIKPNLNDARVLVNTAKRQVDALNLTYDHKTPAGVVRKQVVGVVRPPLTTPAYGTALGLIDPATGQIQFTFDSQTARDLRQEILKKPNVSRVVRSDTFVYPLNKNVDAPKGMCAAPA